MKVKYKKENSEEEIKLQKLESLMDELGIEISKGVLFINGRRYDAQDVETYVSGFYNMEVSIPRPFDDVKLFDFELNEFIDQEINN
jgi:hypothetical protein